MRSSAFVALLAAVLLPACTSLGDVVRAGDVARVHAMLAKSHDGLFDYVVAQETPLIFASKAGNLAMVKELADAFHGGPNEQLDEALLVAMRATPASHDMAGALLDRGAVAQHALQEMLPSSPVADIVWLLEKCAAFGHNTLTLTQFLLDAMHSERPDRGELVTKLLRAEIHWPQQVHEFEPIWYPKDLEGNSPLHLAAIQGQVEWTRLLLEQAPTHRIVFDPDRGNVGGKTALALASNPEVVALLEEHHASRRCSSHCGGDRELAAAQEAAREEARERAAREAADKANLEYLKKTPAEKAALAKAALAAEKAAAASRGRSGGSTSSRPSAPATYFPISPPPAKNTSPICASYSATLGMRKNAGCN